VQRKWKESKVLAAVLALIVGLAATLLFNVIVGVVAFVFVAAFGGLGWYRQTRRAQPAERR
jgi:hypothetical protein